MINIVEKLKNCPKGTKLYSPLAGEVELDVIREELIYPIRVFVGNPKDENSVNLSEDGRFFHDLNGECVLFPSKDNRDWETFRYGFDFSTLKPFDKVLVRTGGIDAWRPAFFSYMKKDGESLKFYTINGGSYRHCMPYNDETESLIGTTQENPKFYQL